jgi:hypothetical protein
LVRLDVGFLGEILKADPAETMGMKWEVPDPPDFTNENGILAVQVFS